MRYAVMSGGKRFRPFLTIESAALFGLPADTVLDAAAALELIHCYSLVHDDLPAMDDDDLRRGLPTVHKRFDEATAILTGDTLLTFAFEVLADPRTHADPAVRAELVLAVARAAGASGMAGGQQLDLEAETTPSSDLAGVLRIQRMKTGALISAACQLGAIAAGAGEEARNALRVYADALGLAFQISDDLLDVEGDAGVIGKATSKDAVAGKATFVSLLGIAGARAKLAELEAEAIAALTLFGNRGRVLSAAARFVTQRRH
jgi:farnesyl diphosphate synthase